MQGQRSAIGSLPDSIDFDFGSASSNVGIDQQIFWNNLRDPAETMLSDFQVLPGESSSNNLQNPVDHVGQTSEEPTVGSSRTGINLNLNMSQISSGPSFENNLEPSASSSGIGRFLVEEVDGRRLSCKRKTTEGQSSSSISPIPEASGSNPNPVNPTLELNMARLIPDDIAAASRSFRLNVGQPNRPLELGSHRNIHGFRLNGALRSRAGNPSTSIVDTPVSQDLNLRPLPRDLADHPLLSVLHDPAAVARHVGSGSRAGPGWGSAHGHPPQYSRRVSEYVRRSLISTMGPEARGVGGSSTLNRSVPSSSQEVVVPTSRAHWMERHGDGAIGIPYSLRALSAGGEGRNRFVSEQIRNALDTMRRGEGLRFEDVMMLDPSVFFGMANIHDQHRDMRLDVDNMSYEELLALEERIGNVCTGLSAETITARMKQRKHVSTMIDQAEIEPCCICQEEYDDGESLGTLDCGHDFHSGCIKQWLEQKNMCPICKTTALSSTT